MFSIEKTLEEVVSFIQKFLLTFSTVLFRLSRLLLRQNALAEKLIRPNLYLLICLLFFLAFAQMDLFFITEDFGSILGKFLKFLSAESLGEKILYVIPLGASIYLIVYLGGKLLYGKSPLFEFFRSLTYYVIGTSLLLYLLLQFMIVAIACSADRISVPPLMLNRILLGLHLASFLVCVLFSFIPLRKKEYFQDFRYLLIPFLAPFSVLFCIYFFKYFIPFTDLSRKQPIAFFSKEGFEQYNMTVASDSTGETKTLCLELIMKNIGKDALFVKKNDGLFIKAWRKDTEPEWSDNYQLFLPFDRLDPDTTRDFVILKPGDFLQLRARGSTSATVMDTLLKVTEPNGTNCYNVMLQYYGYGEDAQMSHSFWGTKQLCVDIRTF